jgi:hypothetical protein
VSRLRASAAAAVFLLALGLLFLGARSSPLSPSSPGKVPMSSPSPIARVESATPRPRPEGEPADHTAAVVSPETGAASTATLTEEPTPAPDGVSVLGCLRLKDGRPFAEADLELVPVPGESLGKALEAVSAADGTFAFRPVPPGRYRLGVYLKTFNQMVPEARRLKSVDVGRGSVLLGDLLVPFVLEPKTSRVLGRVVGPGGAPVAAAKVAVVGHVEETFVDEEPEISTRELETDAAGRFELGELHRERLVIFAHAGDLVTVSPVRAELGCDQTLAVVVPLELGGAIAGLVSAPAERLARGPEVWIRPVPLASSFADEVDAEAANRDASIEADGRYRVAGLAPGSYRVSVGQTTEERSVEVVAGRDVEVNFFLLDAVEKLTVRVDGGPPGTYFHFFASWPGPDGEPAGIASVSNVTSGVATFEHVRAVPVHARVVGEYAESDFIVFERDVPVAAGAPAELRIAWPHDAGAIEGRLAPRDGRILGVVRAFGTTCEGRTQVRQDRTFRLAHLPPGRYRVLLTATGTEVVDPVRGVEVDVEPNAVVRADGVSEVSTPR